MPKTALLIKGDQKNVLSVFLLDILNCITEGSKYKWSILWLEAIGAPSDNLVLELEKKIKNSELRLGFDWNDLIKMSGRFEQIIEILLIGDSNESTLRRYEDDKEMYENCYFTIELIDSSYWIIRSGDDEFLTTIKKTLAGVEEIDN